MEGRRKTSVETGSMKKKQYNFEKKKKSTSPKKIYITSEQE